MHRNEFINMIDNLLLYGDSRGSDYDDLIESIVVSGIGGSGGEPVLVVKDLYEDIGIQKKHNINHRHYLQNREQILKRKRHEYNVKKNLRL